MGWYLNRTGQHEGPFEEAQLVHMIQTGQVNSGHVCVEGGQQWQALNSHPPFAQALEAAARASAPPGAGYPGAPGAVGAQGYAGAPQGYGAAPQAAGAHPGAAAGPKKKLPMAAIAGGAGAAVLLLIIVLVVAFSGGSSAKLASSVPKDTELFFEVPSVEAAVGGLLGMDMIRAKDVDAKKWREDVIDGLVDAFELKKDEAEDIVDGLDGIAMAARGLSSKQAGAALFKFGSSDGIDKLLESERFTKDGDFAGGVRYFVKKGKDKTYSEMKEWKAPKKGFWTYRLSKERKKKAFVWFGDEQILAIGKTSFVEDVGKVISGDKEALTDSERWGKADFPSGGAAVLYLDSEILGESKSDDQKKFARDYMSDAAPFTAGAAFESAGLVTTMRAQLKGAKLDEEDEVGSVSSLDVVEKLPKETVAYVAFSTKRDLKGKALRKHIKKKLDGVEDGMGDKFDKASEQVKDQLDFSIIDIFDSVGDHLAFALVVDPKLKLEMDKLKPEELMSTAGAFAYVIHVGKEESAKKIVKSVRKKLFDGDDGKMKGMYAVKKKKNGFNASPEKDELPHVRIRFEGDYMAFAIGAEKYVKRVMSSLKDGKDSLGDNEAHKSAMSALDVKPHLLMWFDAGTVGKIGIDALGDKADDIFDAMKKETGISRKAIRLKGDKRMTAAFAVMADGDGKTIDLEVKTLNIQAFSMLGAVSYLQKAMAPPPPPPPPPPPAGGYVPGHPDFVMPAGASYSKVSTGGEKHLFLYKQRYTYRGIRTMMAVARQKLKARGWATRFLARHKYRVTKGSRTFELTGGRGLGRRIVLTVHRK